MKRLIILFLLFSLNGCIGTDLVDQPLGNDQSRVALNLTSIALEEGNSRQLEATYFNFMGDPAPADFEWRTDDESVATVSDDGLVTAAAFGQTLVTVEEPSGLSATCMVTVVADPDAVAELVVEADAQTLEPGQTVQLSVTAKNVNGEELPGPVAAT